MTVDHSGCPMFSSFSSTATSYGLVSSSFSDYSVDYFNSEAVSTGCSSSAYGFSSSTSFSYSVAFY